MTETHPWPCVYFWQGAIEVATKEYEDARQGGAEAGRKLETASGQVSRLLVRPPRDGIVDYFPLPAAIGREWQLAKG